MKNKIKQSILFVTFVPLFGMNSVSDVRIYACETVAACQSQISNAEQERQKIQSEINDVKTKTETLIAEIGILEQKYDTYTKQIEAADQTILLLAEQSEQLQNSMKETEMILKDRLVALQLSYETNQSLNFIANASSITEMIERSQAMNDFTVADQELIETYNGQHRQVIENKAKTEQTKSELESYRNEQSKMIQENQQKITEFNKLQEELHAADLKAEETQKLSESQLKEIQAALTRVPVTQPQSGAAPSAGGQPTVQNGRVYPLKHAKKTAGYGQLDAVHLIPHNGTDYGPRGDATLYSMVDGVVVANKQNSARGWLVAIAFNDGKGLKTLLYQHMASASPFAIGQSVSKGQIIGVAGDTGLSYGVHLHVEVGDAGPNGQWIDRGAAATAGLYPTEVYFGLPYEW